MTMRGLLLLALALLAAPFASTAQAQLAGARERHMAVSLVPEQARAPAGGSVTLALAMRPDPGWHGYWANPGEAGAPTRVAWDLPPGVEAGPLLYPVPDRLTLFGLMNYVYEGPYAHLIELRLPRGLAPGTRLPVRGRVDYLVCTDEVCVPEAATVATEITVGESGQRDPRFDAWRAAMPRPLGRPGRFEMDGGRLRVAVPVPAGMEVADLYLFPLTEGALDYGAAQLVSRRGDMLIVETQAAEGAAGAEALRRLDGVLKIGDDTGLAFAAYPGDVPAAGVPVAGARAQSGGRAAGLGAVLLAFLGAMLGGLILNILPCVFPILSLKALSLARAGESQSQARREGAAYTAGAVAACLALGGVLLAVRAGGAAVGWAFQLQEPKVILALLLLVTAIALNLAGLFRLPALAGGESLARSGGTQGAFWTGALAAFVATPCTGPFMGAALGAAVVLPAAAALAVFGGLGLGLALPFLLLGFVPALRRMLPRPGPWMERFQRILSVPMFLTALGLAWILGRQTGADGMALGLAAALALGLALWWAGRSSARAVPLALAVAAALGAALLLRPAPAASVQEGPLAAEPFSEARLAQLRGEGRPVFVYFTADWCLTCKVNEEGALKRDAVAKSFAAKNVAVLEGDWTTGDAEIGRFLERHGRSGVPLYLYYPPDNEAQILPQLLTVGRLTALD